MRTQLDKRQTVWRGFVFGILTAVLAIFIAGGCGKDEIFNEVPNPIPPIDGTMAAYTDSGWAHFESGDYAGALTWFAQALGIDPNFTDALAGQGWSYLRLENLTQAIVSLDSGVVHGPYWQRNSMYVKALVGQCLAASATEDYAKAATAGILAADLGGESYRFPHDTSIGVQNVRLAVAEAYVRLGYYELAYGVLAEIDVTVLNRVDPGSEEFVSQLLEELTRISLGI